MYVLNYRQHLLFQIKKSFDKRIMHQKTRRNFEMENMI